MENVQESRASQDHSRSDGDGAAGGLSCNRSEEQRVERVLAEVSRARRGVPVWTWSLTEGMRRDGRPAEPGTEDPRTALDFIVAHPTAPRSSPEGLPRASARVHRDPPPAARRLRGVPRPGQVRRDLVACAVRARGDRAQPAVPRAAAARPRRADRFPARRDRRSRERRRLPPMARALQGLTLDEARYALRARRRRRPSARHESMPALLEEKKPAGQPQRRHRVHLGGRRISARSAASRG